MKARTREIHNIVDSNIESIESGKMDKIKLKNGDVLQFKVTDKGIRTTVLPQRVSQ